MRDVFLDFKLPEKPILILGKGPSLSRYTPSMKDQFYVIGINQVGEHLDVDITFLIHGEHATKDPMILPYYPHIGKKPGPLSTHSHAYHYNLNTAPHFFKGPIITTDGFTIHALLNVLGLLNVSTICTLGVDGGKDYSNIIQDTPHCDFDLQFSEIKKLISKYNFDLKPLQPFGNKAGHRETVLSANE